MSDKWFDRIVSLAVVVGVCCAITASLLAPGVTLAGGLAIVASWLLVLAPLAALWRYL